MADLRTALLPALDRIRGIPGRLGLRLYSVTVRVRTWTGARPGLGTATSADKAIWVDAGTHKARVKQVTQRDILASGGLYQDQDLRVGPITPLYQGGAADHADITAIDPTPGVSAGEVFFILKGPGMAVGGSWFRKVGQDVTSPLGYTFVIRRTAEVSA